MRFDVAPYLHVPTRNLWRPTWVWLCYMLPTYLKRWPTPQLPAPAATVLPTYPKYHELTPPIMHPSSRATMHWGSSGGGSWGAGRT